MLYAFRADRNDARSRAHHMGYVKKASTDYPMSKENRDCMME